MKMATFPTFEILFPGEPKPNFKEPLSTLSSNTILMTLCVINAQLHFDPHNKMTQISILGFLLQGQEENYRIAVLERAWNFFVKQDMDDRLLFTTHYTLELIHYMIIHYDEFVPESLPATAEEELNFTKAYVLFIEKSSEKIIEKHKPVEYKTGNDYFRKTVWGTFFEQIEAQYRQHFYTGAIRAIAFLNYLLDQEELKDYVTKYLGLYGFDTPWKYVLSVMHVIQVGWSKQNDKRALKPFTIKSSPEYDPLLRGFSLDIPKYQKLYYSDKQNFSGLKASPLLQLPGQDSFFAIHWNLLTSKFYDGLFFDFYEKSGIQSDPKFNTIPNFKNHIAIEVSEKILFKGVFQELFKNQKTLIFPLPGEEGRPDAYYRKSNRVLLVEFKDAAFGASAISSQLYDDIVNVIDTKYNTEKKGTGQIIKYLQNLSDTSLYEKHTQERIRRSSELVIYPVIVYTDKFFGVAGVNDYLADQFDQRVSNANLRDKFASIKRLTCLDFNEMVVYFKAFSEGKNNLFDAIDKYSAIIKNRKKRENETRNFDDLIKSQERPEEVLWEYLRIDARHAKGYFGKLSDVFDLSKGLPKGD